jgi:hypothetical protein
MGKVLTDNAGVAAAGSADPGCLTQQLNSLCELIIINVILHFPDAGFLNIIGSPCSQDRFLLNHNDTPSSYFL